MKRRMTAFINLILFFFTSFLSPITVGATVNDNQSPGWPTGPNIYAEGAIVMEASTGLILYEKNIDNAYYPASITKILTALIAIENSSMGEIVTFSRDAIFNVELNSSRIGIDVGEQLTMQQCLYAILLESANEVTYGVAEHIGGSIENFSKMMNERAKSIGAMNSNFTNPHGLPDDDHYSTPYDMALITREAMKNETFRKIFGTRTYQIPPTNIQEETRYLRNHHRFVLKQDYRYDDCIGGKTGYTSKARFTLVSVAKRGDLELISIVMKDDSSAHQYADTKALFDYGFDNFSIYPINELETEGSLEESPMFTRFNPLLSEKETPIVTDENGYLVLPNTASFQDAEKDISFYPSPEIQEGNNIIGNISYTYMGKYVGGANILYNNTNKLTLETKELNIKNPAENSSNEDTESKTTGRLYPIILGIIAGILVLIMSLYYIFVERPRLKRRKAYYKKRANRRKHYHDDYLNL
ncbi:MAG: D-alanyl-D-alanine carboxypeptidase [Clostridiales bacterium]|nr:D-alanyl-D-alanine carboxypeptidase [Clostridiales bacterium]